MSAPGLQPVGAFALWTALVLASAPAAAYRPPARALLEQAMDRQFERGTRVLRVEADVQTFDVTGTARGLPVVERTLFQAPAAMRRETELPDGVRVEIRSDDKLLVKSAGQPDKSSKAPVDLLLDQVVAGPPLEAEGAVERLLRDLKTLGINPEVVSFARFDGRVCFLIGSKPWETDKPQLWLDKETLLVSRVVIVQKASDGKLTRTDVRYLGWGSPVGGNWYPSGIEVYSDDKLVRRSVVRSVERNIPMDAALFQLR